VGRRRDKGLSEEDRRLWWRVTQSVEPLPGRSRPEAPDDAQGARPPAESPLDRARPPELPATAKPRTTSLHALDATTAHGIDRRTARRFRRGELPIDAHLDLHGMTRERAHETLQRFLTEAVARGCRCIVVVTGKGQRGPLEPHTGVLKATLPRWLNEPGARAKILAFAPARPQHGGEGAFYVLLKRAR
jgi:DNA-nicking Smr family endonuclease